MIKAVGETVSVEQDTHQDLMSTNKLGAVAYASHPSYTKGIDRSIMVQGPTQAKRQDPIKK
jgi:hypothetical protein